MGGGKDYFNFREQDEEKRIQEKKGKNARAQRQGISYHHQKKKNWKVSDYLRRAPRVKGHKRAKKTVACFITARMGWDRDCCNDYTSKEPGLTARAHGRGGKRGAGIL